MTRHLRRIPQWIRAVAIVTAMMSLGGAYGAFVSPAPTVGQVVNAHAK